MATWTTVTLFVVACTGCASRGPAPVVTAPSSPAWHAAADPEREPPSATAFSNALAACGKPLDLEVMGGGGQVVVVCAHDVRRAALDESSAFTRALLPGLDAARDRVCDCATRVRAPPFVDLTITAHPEEGRVTVQAGGDDDDPELGAAFVACVGTVAATFPPVRSDVCTEGGKTSFVYPVTLELASQDTEPH